MWIRSQDNKKIVDASNIVCVKEEYCEKYAVYVDEVCFINVGEYYSQDKVIRVLDMIENSIKRDEKVFQMPADEEVEE